MCNSFLEKKRLGAPMSYLKSAIVMRICQGGSIEPFDRYFVIFFLKTP
uniref:Uncharacterized protein n=1 Tax=Nelumbo nucifera TaxID=4432 RepID=A0A822ZPM9_NELNU|nr:TPA_asm: hypothetical protein HUJ06_003665 [Nelumbo nucifera]